MKRLHELLVDATAGDPVSGLRWTHKSTRALAKDLQRSGLTIGRSTVARLLRQSGYALRTNRKRLARTQDPDRDRQFRYLARQRRDFQRQGNPVVSIDAKKKELVGLFKNPGVTWRQRPRDVLDHDFPSAAKGRAIPYGVYDPVRNTGFVVVGTSHETADFAAAALERWWEEHGRWCYPRARRWLLQADGGGGNGYRLWAWKAALQRLADRWQVAITVGHYPPGASKWNAIEHRLFNRISGNWQGEPLKDYETILNFIRTTTTDTGLRCRAILDTAIYPTRIKISQEQKDLIRLQKRKVLPQWNYTVYPHRK